MIEYIILFNINTADITELFSENKIIIFLHWQLNINFIVLFYGNSHLFAYNRSKIHIGRSSC